jgi:hypothetical protein
MIYGALGDRLPGALSMADHVAAWRVAGLVGGVREGVGEVKAPHALSSRVLCVCEVITGAIRWRVSLRLDEPVILGVAPGEVGEAGASVGLGVGVYVPPSAGRVKRSARRLCWVGVEGRELVAVDVGPYTLGERLARDVLGEQLRGALRSHLVGYSREAWPLVVGREVVLG